jgi:hypothetical protein
VELRTQVNSVARIAAVTTLMLLSGICANAQQRVVLVVAADSPIDSITVFEARKLYLGIDVLKQGNFLRPLRNVSSADVEQIFLQSVIGLTKAHYERRLLRNLLRLGSVRPQEFEDLDILGEELARDKFSVTYAFDDGRLQGVKVLRILWQE